MNKLPVVLYLVMQIVKLVFAGFFFYLSVKLLPPPRYKVLWVALKAMKNSTAAMFLLVRVAHTSFCERFSLALLSTQ